MGNCELTIQHRNDNILEPLVVSRISQLCTLPLISMGSSSWQFARHRRHRKVTLFKKLTACATAVKVVLAFEVKMCIPEAYRQVSNREESYDAPHEHSLKNA